MDRQSPFTGRQREGEERANSASADMFRSNLPPHPFKRDLVMLNGGDALVSDLVGVVERTRSCPINTYVKLREEDAIFQKVTAQQTLILRAVWRMGKTEMLATMFSRKHLLDQTIALNFQSAPSSALTRLDGEDFRMGLGREAVAEFISRKTLLASLRPEEIDYPDLLKKTIAELEAGRTIGKTPFSILNEFLEQKKEVAYIVFDEAIVLATNRDAVRELRSVADLPHLRTIVVLQKHQINEGRFLSHFGSADSHFVECLDIPDCQRIADALTAGTKFTISREAVDEINRLSGGRPFETSAITHIAIASLVSEGIMEGAITPTRVRDSLEALLQNPSQLRESVLVAALENYQKIIKTALNAEEQSALTAIAKHGALPITDVGRDVLRTLDSFRLIRVDTSGTSNPMCSINGELFRQVINEPARFSAFDHWTPDEYGNDYV